MGQLHLATELLDASLRLVHWPLSFIYTLQHTGQAAFTHLSRFALLLKFKPAHRAMVMESTSMTMDTTRTTMAPDV